MASTIVAESSENVEDKDDSLIIIVNPDGTITVDPETLQKLISTNQHAGNVSVVRVDGEDSVSVENQGGTDASQVNLTVEGFYSQTPQDSILPEIPSEVDDANKNDDVLDPFSQLDPEHLARLESALQSEQAKEILGHKLGDNLNEMLDILEQNDDKTLSEPQIEEPMVHNDHSYTSVAPFQNQSPSVTSRPLMRGGRTRMRGATGRILTRGGLSRTSGGIGSQTMTTLASGKNIPKNIIITQGGRMLQPTLTADGKIQKKVITSISPNILSASKIATIAGQPGNKVILKTTDGHKKTVIPVRVQKAKKVVQSPSKIDLETEKLKKQLEDELGEAHSPIPKFDPTIPNADKKLTFQQVVTIFKEKPNVVVKKFSPKSEDGKSVKKPKDVKQEVKPVKVDTPTTPAPTTPKAKQAEDDAKKKKEKGKATPTTPLVLGPELFSTPDIIRRVSTDKTNAVEAVQEPSTPVETQPEAPSEPEAKVQSLDSIISSNCEIISAESLLDSIHAEVAKDPRFLDQGLLDELTNDDDEMDAIEMIGNDIEDTLEKMEESEVKIVQNSTPVMPQNASMTPNVRKLPPIELPTTRSATKKAAAAKFDPNDSSAESSQKAKLEAKRASVDSRKSSGESRKPSIKAEEEDDDDDDYMESDGDSVNSEDDPNRLWCICQKPHNNRFMICCDSCEDWFHGKCVGITKALGQQMEADGVEWTCPNCRDAKRKAAATKAKADALPPAKLAQKQPVKAPSQQMISSLKCITCKKPAKVESNYCGEICIRKHCSMMIEVLKRDTLGLEGKTPIVVFEKQSGRLLSGERAPTLFTLSEWMEKHKTFEVINPNMLPVNKYYKMNPARPTAQANKPQQLPKKPVQTTQNKPLVQQKLTLNLNKQVSIDKMQANKITSPPVNKLTSPTGNKLTSPTGNKVSSPTIKTLAPKTMQAQKTIVIQKSIQPVKTVQTAQKAAVSTPKTPQPAQKVAQPLPKPQQKTVSVQKTIQLIPTQVQTPVKAKVEEEKKKKPVTPVIEKKKEEKVEPKKERKSKEEPKTTPIKEEPKKQPEPIRANVKRTLQELLLQRAQQDPDLKPTTDEIKELVASIEEELFNLFKDVGAKYKSKYRSLVFNIKDAKNLTLYKKIIEKSVSPSQLVRLSPEELASQELAQWREKEAKHQIDIIKKNELDLIHLSKTVVLKSRKGEEIIESKNHEASISELESALNRTAEDDEVEVVKKDKKDDIQSILSSISKRKKEEEKRRDKKDRKRRRSRSRRSKSRERRRKSESDSRRSRSEKEKRTSKDRSRSKDRSGSKDSEESKKGTESLERSRSKDSPEKSSKDLSTEVKVEEKIEMVDVKEEPEREEEFGSMTPPPPSEKKLKEDDSDREPSSTTINTPPYVEEKPPFWSGILNMSEVTKLYTSAYEVSGSCDDLEIELTSNLECVGRIQPDSVWDYVSRMKKAGTKEIIVIRFQSDTKEEKMNYLSLYSYLNSRNRMAVVGAVSKTVKDFYVLPLASHSPIPQVLLPLDGPGFEDYRPHLLLGIIIRSKKGGISLSSFPTHHKKKHSKVGRSYTPPLPDGSTTPPLLSNSSVKRLPLRGLTPPLPDLDDEPYSPGENDPYSPGDAEESLLLKQNPDIQKNLEEVNRMIEEKRLKIESMTSAAALPAIPGINEDEDENEAYSPSERFTPPPPGSSAPNDPIPFFDTKLTDIKLPSNLQEILASIKGTDAPQPKTLDVNSDPIVKAYSSGYLDEDDDEEDEKSPVVEKTSRDPRQRPEEKPPKSALSLLSDAELIRKAAEMEEARQQPETQRYYPMVPALPYPQQMPFTPAPTLPISIPGPIMPAMPGTVIMPPIMPPHPPPPHPDFPVKDHAFPPHKDFRRNKKWEQRRQGPNQGNFGNRRGNFDRGGRFRNRFQGQRQGRGNSNNPNFRNQRPRYDGVQSEWDEEIRNFEQRRRKRRNSRSRSRSSSPRRRRQKRDSESS